MFFLLNIFFVQNTSAGLLQCSVKISPATMQGITQYFLSIMCLNFDPGLFTNVETPLM